MNKPLASVLAGALTVFVGGAVAPAASGAGPRSLDLVGRETHSAEVPAPGEGFVGARFVGADALFDGSTNVGIAGRSCEVVATNPDHSAVMQCVLTLRLHNGTITLQALTRLTETGLEEAVAAVTGGTGRYRDARGSVTLTEQAEGSTGYRLDLR